MKLRKGNKVAWISQSKGTRLTKLGKVVEIVPAGYVPIRKALGTKQETRPLKNCESRSGRSHESYVVDVNGKYYWPSVNKLVLL